ncbi:ABC transporter ATP-binding protein/permease [Companilactobacillus sp.]|jgi:putative ABC transport system permease protein|uniref:ABC transporter ATP-binding protein/permease n=1 Tax=Companilactobacillus sp. TaxID=2767905 RepID=UPI0025B974E6|nr:ABC transporter ATP-binding protein/permease [Companilactobacillus sp.]MCH4009805.1 ATP-binding cassette domain-containing protein [Companilactobacillus sp.]MCH4052519.1 ATP-binding cassette domain-containing protein [Companilactobacillus sp.]MCH4077747.1 ATP-binding cassette domain-containing protein [Companilactobacillus sp.]MCH4126323.1 ATP-binding cassette domain-containing protein [Companilactobacillus sp.]MCI1312031.1 ATP-binding cassette domain-containing protein [Companilactobacillu
MLELKHIKKYYYVGDSVTKALDDVSVSFRKQEFVAILGPSGSGKTTMLNGIGGLDIYDSGDLVIKGKSTKDFTEADWDAYRNNSVGFIFQSYNIIGHLSILDNVEMGMTLSGVGNDEKKQKAIAALERVGLGPHIHKRPNQLSGGQMQRVAIARAIANDPEILLCDEPTGALDTETSEEIMKLIKELSEERLVIMVTHNPTLAKEYADRIINFADGKIQNDSNPFTEDEIEDHFELKKTKMTFWTALKLSFTNLKTKKARTALTAFASSIGIISIAIVLALSSGFQKQIDKTQSNTLAQFPVTISQTVTKQSAQATKEKKVSKSKQVTAKLSEQEKATHTNKITSNYQKYIKNMDPDLAKNVTYTYTTGMNLLSKENGKVKTAQFSNADTSSSNSMSGMQAAMASSTGVGVSVYPSSNDGGTSFLKKHYSVLSGSMPKNENDIVLIVDRDNSTNINALKNIGINVKNNQKLDFNKIVGTQLKIVNNNDYYKSTGSGTYAPNTNLSELYNNNNNRTVKISGILRVKSKSSENILSSGIAYSDKLTQDVIQDNKNSDIVKAQKDSETNVLTNASVDKTTKDSLVSYLGGSTKPASILIYPNTFKNKDKVLSYLDKYNKGKSSSDKVIYTDLAGQVSNLTGGLMDAITYVLVAFAGISLVTSMIMIAIITYTSVLERTKEIGILKALGARKKDITRVFDAETTILGVSSGLLGVIIAWLATFPINMLLKSMTDLSNVAQLNPVHAIILIIISTVLTVLGGHIPARMAAKKDAATALRSE